MAVAVLLLLCIATVADSSTIGVQRISEVLELQEHERSAPHVQVSAAQGVLHRLLPSHSSALRFQIVSKEQCGGASCFIIKNNPSFVTRIVDPEILIYGVTGVEILAGLHWYLKNWCGAHVSWDKTGGVQLFSVPKPGSLPRVSDEGVLVQRPIPWSYYQNAVTSSYSFAWWDWKRWEKEIDWMALQGINLPLAFTGQEAIWQKVFRKFNLSGSDLNDFFGGPAFLSWSRMGNLHGWGGPLPQSWLDQQLNMQKKILQRMYELGMTPVLPAFSGNVPAALRTRFPSAKITRLGNWFSVHSDPRWTCTYLLDATDPLFVEIGREFIEQQLQEYGKTSHIYNCDTFDENTPPNDDPKYISSLGAAIFEGMRSGDENAVWLMQGWLFLYDPYWRPPQMKALLHSVPLGKMVVLDLFAEVKPIWITSQQFYGVPYIWCMLHNFAGNSEMYGVMNAIASGPIDALTSQSSTMVGVGMAMEGIEQNPVVYDLMSEMAFRREKVNVESWINRYSTRRYGQSVSSIRKAWNILYQSIYNCSDGAFDKNRDVIVAFPDVEPLLMKEKEVIKEVSESYEEPHLWYSTSQVIHALELFLEAGEELCESKTFRYDLVDLTRQALAKYGNELFLEIIQAYKYKDVRKVTILSRTFLELVGDIDALLACDDGFLLGPWLESAKRLAQNEEQEKQFEWNARTQITMWFDNSDEEPSLLRDYGNKYWSGLLRDYYGPRAAIYFKYLVKSLENCEGFELKNWRRDWIKLTNQWQGNRSVYPLNGVGNALNTSKRLYKTYLQSQSLGEEAIKLVVV